MEKRKGMRIVISVLIVIWGLLLVGGPAGAEYYQYKDENGNTCFTDDISDVPESQRDKVKHFESVKSKPRSSEFGRRSKTQKKSREIQTPAGETWDGQMKKKAEALERENEKLQKSFQELQQEKRTLNQKSPEQMTEKERNAHAQKIRELNSRIKRYNERREDFSKKVDRFNIQIQQKSSADGGEET